MIPPTDDGHCSRGLGSDKGVDGRVLKFPSTSPNELRVTLYDPLRGVPVVELEVVKKVSYATGKHTPFDVVIPLGAEGCKGFSPDSGEAQGLRIGYKFMEIQ